MSNDKLQKWALIAEIIGGIAIVVSLIFVGIQVRHSADETRQAVAATKAATVLQLKQSWVDLNLTKAASPELLEAWVSLEEASGDIESLDRRTQFFIISNLRVMIHNWSNAYYQFRVGTLEQEQWDALVRDIERSSKDQFFWIVWDAWEDIFDDPFRELINSRRPSE